jgi:hypothetical protein
MEYYFIVLPSSDFSQKEGKNLDFRRKVGDFLQWEGFRIFGARFEPGPAGVG